MERFIDNLYFYLGFVGRCNMCRYKNIPIYDCPNKLCFHKYCLDCYKDTIIENKTHCKSCLVYEFD